MNGFFKKIYFTTDGKHQENGILLLRKDVDIKRAIVAKRKNLANS